MATYKEPVKEAPCKNACPAGIDVPRYVRLIAESKFDEALAVIRERIPFPSVCGRVCYHPCEDKCNSNYLGRPIAICALKRFVAESPQTTVKESSSAKPTGKRVAVIGAGPAGLTAAYYLVKLGHAVTVFEALPEPGGLMRYGIPDYRLPKDILVAEINAIKKAGVEIKNNSRTETPSKLLEQGYNAVFVAVGAWKGVPLGIEGQDIPAVRDAVTLMMLLNSKIKIRLGEKVVVVGGGNAAIDAARSALRLGSKEVTIIYRRSREEMPANLEEVEQALAEGVKIQFLTAPTKVEKVDGKVELHCMRTQLGKKDASGRREAKAVPGSEFIMDANTVVSAIGRMPEPPAELKGTTAQGGGIKADAVSLATGQKGIFAGGDAVNGATSIIEAIAAGRRAAVSIDKYLGGKGEIDVTLAPPGAEPVQTELQGFPVGSRTEMPSLPVDERVKDFVAVELGYNQEQAVNEAKRCLKCDLPITVEPESCVGCLTCVMRCGLKYGDVSGAMDSKITVIPLTEETNEIIFSDECDTCGICARYCPHDALYRGKRKPVEVKAK